MISKNRTVIIIPARLKSSRLKNKLLLDLHGKSVINRVFNQVILSGIETYIAVDSKEIYAECLNFTDNVIMTSTHHESGTDRIIEAVEIINKEAEEHGDIPVDYVINVQGDEPLISPDLISDLEEKLTEKNNIVTAIHKIDCINELKDPNNVKVVTDSRQNALYFSRSIIPHHRDDWENLIYNHTQIPNALTFYKHIGIYGYSYSFLKELKNTEPSYLERIEKLEQLRFLDMGYKIKVIKTDYTPVGIDTKEDYYKVLDIMEKNIGY